MKYVLLGICLSCTTLGALPAAAAGGYTINILNWDGRPDNPPPNVLSFSISGAPDLAGVGVVVPLDSALCGGYLSVFGATDGQGWGWARMYQQNYARGQMPLNPYKCLGVEVKSLNPSEYDHGYIASYYVGLFQQIFGHPNNLVDCCGNPPRRYRGDPNSPGDCRYDIMVKGALYGVAGRVYNPDGSKRGTCTVGPPPPPVSCKVTSPTELVHPRHSVGFIQSKVSRTLDVLCSSASSVVVSIQSSDLELTGDGSTLPSNLYLGREGETRVEIRANTTGTTELLSTINAQGAVAGDYRGSKVITLNWD